MAITAHVLLTYTCPLRCSHCFVYSGPRARGRFTLQTLNLSLSQIAQIDQIEAVVFSGGEPFLEYPLLLYGVKKARQMGLRVIVITNGFFARNHATGIKFLRALAEVGLDELQVSVDDFHYSNRLDSSGARALQVAAELGIKVKQVRVSDNNEESEQSDLDPSARERICARPLRYFGRAVELVSETHPRFPSRTFTHCPDHDLAAPRDIYLDPGGLVSVCPGVVIGNFMFSSLREILGKHPARDNPILQYLIGGGPAELARHFPLANTDQFTDACHACFTIRKAMLKDYPNFLAPKQVYGSF